MLQHYRISHTNANAFLEICFCELYPLLMEIMIPFTSEITYHDNIFNIHHINDLHDLNQLEEFPSNRVT